MSATKTIENYEVSETPVWDHDLDTWCVRVGIMTRKGLLIHYSVHGKSPEIAINRADILARILSAFNPNNLNPKTP